MESPFKGGDRVRIVRLGLYFPCMEQGLFTGNTATVHKDQGTPGSVYVATDGFEWEGINMWSFLPSELELLQ